MRVRNHHDVDGRQVADANPGPAQPLEDEDPLGVVGIDNEIVSAHLDEEAGMPDEGDAHLAGFRQHWFAGLAGARSNGRVAHQG